MTTGLAEIKHRLDGLPSEVIEEAAARFDEIARQSAGRAVGGQLRLHARNGRRPLVRFKTKAKIIRRGDEAVAFIDGVPAGVWTWIESGTGPHLVGIRSNLRGPVRISFGQDNVATGPISHPGTSGQRAWTRAVGEFKAEMQPLVQLMVDKAVSGGQ